ncbi:MAG: RNA methyltransferase [Clostridia bacterium]|nr:RNA methyltransferase [Clostridia bacterium]
MIVSKDNSQIKHIKQLKQKKYRDEFKEYIVEGIKIVEEAIEEKEDIVLILICEELLNKNVNTYDCKVEFVSKSIFEMISDTVTPQGILAVIKEKEAQKISSNVLFALDDIQDPGNMGTIIRTLDAAGIKDLIISKESADIYNPKVTRSTMGAIYRLNVVRTELLSRLKEMQETGYKIVVTSLATNKNHYDINFDEKTIIVIGNEAKGVSEEIMEIADVKVKIPMLGKSESLNAAMATGILAYEYVRNILSSDTECTLEG